MGIFVSLEAPIMASLSVRELVKETG